MHRKTTRILGALLTLCLVPGAAAVPAAPEIEIGQGSGRFSLVVPGPEGPVQMQVPYYMDADHQPDDPIIMVMAGSGRNAADYRDAWVDAAKTYDLLVLAPRFAEWQFSTMLNYNMAGMMRAGPNARSLADIDTVSNTGKWWFSHIDRIFEAAVEATGSHRVRYDLFGHSAGGQFIHRLVLFAPDTKIDRALAANSGWYTTTEADVRFPYGLEKAPIDAAQLRRALGRHLTVFLGELDDANETFGDLRRTEGAMRQGAGRLERGKFFIKKAAETANALKAPFNWHVHVVPAMGHAYVGMSTAAAHYLYGPSE